MVVLWALPAVRPCAGFCGSIARAATEWVSAWPETPLKSVAARMTTNELHRALVDRWALHSKQWRRVMLMLDEHPSLAKEADEFGYLPAHLVAAFGGRGEVVQKILSMHPEAAAMFNQANWLPLHLAACWGHTEAVLALIELYPEAAYFRDGVDRLRPIERARAMDRPAIVKLLEPLEAGYDAWRRAHPEQGADEAAADPCSVLAPKEIAKLEALEAEDRKVFCELAAQEGVCCGGGGLSM